MQFISQLQYGRRPATNLLRASPATTCTTKMSNEGSVFNEKVLITVIITIISTIIGLYLGRNTKTQDATPPRIIVKSTSQLAYVLAKIQEGIDQYPEEDVIGLINSLLEVLIDEDHPDVDVLHHIVTEVANNRHPSNVYEIWLTMAYRRLATDPRARLPEAWFLEPVAAAPVPDLDVSEISESSTDDEREQPSLLSPLRPQPTFEDDLNNARIYTPQSKLIDLDLPEVGLPKELDMSAVD